MASCSFCGKKFENSTGLFTHLKFHHSCDNKTSVACAEKNCFRKFPSFKSFKQHFLRIHSIDLSDAIPVNVSTSEASTSKLNAFHVIDYTENKSNFDIFERTLNQNILEFVSKFYADNTLPRNKVQEILADVLTLLKRPINLFKIFITEMCTNSNRQECFKYLNKFENMFTSFSSEYLTFKYLEKNGFFISPEEYLIAEKIERTKISRVQKYCGHFISMKKTLTKVFELPDVLSKTLSYIESLKDETRIHNIVQTEWWLNKRRHFAHEEHVFPLLIYSDDFEIGNPLSSHAGVHKLGAVYFSIPVIPLLYQSKLENIFLTNLYHSNDLKEFGNNLIYSKIVEDCNNLFKHGITITLGNRKVKIYFILIFLAGDNLGINTMLGFTESFSANYFCRFCKCNKDRSRSLSVQDNDILRNPRNYKTDLEEKNLSKTGIREESIWNSVQFFNVTENFYVDIGHDIYEGVALFDLIEILYQIVIVYKIIEVDILNARIRYFDFESHNKPPSINIDNLKNKKLKLSFSECRSLVLAGGILFGDLIPENNNFWKLYIKLRQILTIILSPSVTENMCIQLRKLIEDHHFLYQNLFSLGLKPKHHLLTHYPYILNKVGPVVNISTLRYEAKHRQSKLCVNPVACRINITRTIAIKHQLQFSSRLLQEIGFQDKNDSVNKFSDNATSIFEGQSLFEKQCKLANINFQTFKDCSMVSKISHYNRIYRVGQFICLQKYELDLPIFGSILKILVNKENEVCFLYKSFKTLKFNEHYYSYEIIEEGIQKVILLQKTFFISHLFQVQRNNKVFLTTSF